MTALKFKITQLIAIMVFMIAGISVYGQGNLLQDYSEMKEDLQLTVEQEQELEALNEATKARLNELESLERTERRTQMKTIRKEHKAAIKDILSEEQLLIIKEKKADRHEQRKARGKRTRELRKAIKAHQQQEVKPVLLSKRQDLEKDIAAEDKAKIDDLRAWLKAEKEVIKTERKAHKAERKERKGDRRTNKGERTKERAARKEEGRKRGRTKGGRAVERMLKSDEERNAIAHALVETYSDRIDALEEEISEDRIRWKSERKAIILKHTDEESQLRFKEHMEKRSKVRDAEFKGFHKKLGFLLMQPDEAEPVESTSTKNIHQTKLYPNPAQIQQNLEFTTQVSGQVTVEIIDKSGNIISNVFNGHMDAGTHSLQVNVQNLKGQVFYYRIKDEAGISSKQFIVNND